ncbi:hypothetical protein Nepgr_028167 [Nepenthes gracilis]|uniref:Myb-like domain-containing protein n=1 Tax=Nepenthes gracilis TaxID=150966 RepID=A0AAD3Y3V0_NEPGR|nr:hypothetical protein Nepgr_028167 [Nepenthes gracilis]
MEDQYHQYAMAADLRHCRTTLSTSQFQPLPQSPPPELFSVHHHLGLAPPPLPNSRHLPFEMLLLGRHATDVYHRVAGGGSPGVGVHDFHSDSTTTTTANNNNAPVTNFGGAIANFSGFEVEAGGSGGAGVCLDGRAARWPRQETIVLLEIRSRLAHKFKEANQKGPLWDEVSRLMYEEHGYQRSGKKCKEKFENLYKYYRKTKGGKAGGQNGRHYRFFRQLEALYGDTTNAGSASDAHVAGNKNNYNNTLRSHDNAATTVPRPCQEAAAFQQQVELSDDSLGSLSISSDFDTSSSDDHGELKETRETTDNVLGDEKKTTSRKRSWKAKINELIDSQMRKLMEKQEAWLDKTMRTLDHREQARMLREDEWRKQDAERIEWEHEFWASERAWIEARDAALMEALQKLTGTKQRGSASSGYHGSDRDQGVDENMDHWRESEVGWLVNQRTRTDSGFQQCRSPLSEDQNLAGEETASKIECLGYHYRKEKGDSSSSEYCLIKKSNECNEKRKEISCRRSLRNIGRNDTNNQQGINGYEEIHEQEGTAPETSPSQSNVNTAMDDSCFRFFVGEASESMWEN